ncbi:MAG: beta-lactamase family protein [Micrococcales bacterium]|nr:beta-lactamase family protein [Micrococcales bacterium]
MAFTDRTAALLGRIAVTTQREGRVPGLAAGVARRGELQWSTGVGAADLSSGEAPDADTQYQIASNTKTFVAVTIMALRDEGRLDLDEPIGIVIPESTHGRVTFRQLLAHSSGMQREPLGDVFDTLDFPDRADLVAGWNQAEQVGRPHTHWHYSNLGFAMLGEAITRLDGGDWFASVQRRILDPLEMRRTTLGPSGRQAGTYFVPPHHDVPEQEPVIDVLAVGPAGGMASTTADLARWGGFVADPVAEVLSPDTLEEMCQPQILAEPQRWGSAWGLGFMLVRADDRVWVGHTGGWPGSITGVFTHRDSGTTGITLMNASNSPDPAAAAIELGACSLAEEPPLDEAWAPGSAVPDGLAPVLGVWFSEGTAFTFTVREGRLEARVDGLPSWRPPAVFEQLEGDVYRTVSGRERGELLRITRRPDGTVERMHWATYLFTREPLAFGAHHQR